MRQLGLVGRLSVTRNPAHTILAKEWRAVLMNDPCVYCGAPPDGLDHIVANSLGGSDGWGNRAPACQACDEVKRNVPLVHFLWMRRRADLRMARRPRYGNNEQMRRAAARGHLGALTAQWKKSYEATKEAS